MVGLLDINILVALFDPNHGHHEQAHDWFAGHARNGWATSSITQNGLVRIISHPSYPGRRTELTDAANKLRTFCQSELHAFWEDAVSITDPMIRLEHVRGPGQITDATLLALAVRHQARLVSFDRRLNWRSVVGARANSIVHP